MSTTLILANMRHEVPADEVTVRSNTYVTHNDASPAEQQGPPEFNEVETDPDPTIGMEQRNMASMWVEGEQYTPFWASNEVETNKAINTRVNDTIASSGTAAARELSGEFGHGTAKYAVGIEPVQDLQGHGGYGADYFTFDKPTAQEYAGDYMTSPIVDRDVQIAVSQAGRNSSRDASVGSYEGQWYAAIVGGEV
jgi:hypothetical protein